MDRTEEHLTVIAADKVIGYDALDGAVQKGCIFSVEYTRPKTEDVVDIVLTETAVSSSRALLVVTVAAIVRCG